MSATDLIAAADGPEPSRAHLKDPGPADAAMAALSEQLKRDLALLHDAPPDVVERSIGLLPYGWRELLETYELIVVSRPGAEVEGKGEQPLTRIAITDLGRAVIEACANPSLTQL